MKKPKKSPGLAPKEILENWREARDKFAPIDPRLCGVPGIRFHEIAEATVKASVGLDLFMCGEFKKIFEDLKQMNTKEGALDADQFERDLLNEELLFYPLFTTSVCSYGELNKQLMRQGVVLDSDPEQEICRQFRENVDSMQKVAHPKLPKASARSGLRLVKAGIRQPN